MEVVYGDTYDLFFPSILLASTFSRDGKHLEFSQGRSCKAVSDDFQCGKDLGDQPLDRLGECATNLASNEHGLEANPRNDVSSGEKLRVGNKGAQVPLESENVSKTCNGVESLTEVNGPRSSSVKEEVCISIAFNSLCTINYLYNCTCKAVLLLC